MMKMNAKDNYLCWLDEDAGMKWWHDSADLNEILTAMDNRACGVTTNPVLVYQALNSYHKNREFPPSKTEGEVQSVKSTELSIKSVISRITRILDPVYKRTEGAHGYVCAQVDPHLSTNAEKMFEMAKRFQSWAPNIAVKLPVTKEGLEVLEECVAEGINTIGTVSFTVPQVLAVGERHRLGSIRARKNGKKPGFGSAVIMIGRLDDYLIDITKGTDLNTDILTYAGIAVVKRAYSLFSERGYETRLLVAALRGSYHVEHLTGGSIILSIHPKYQHILLTDEIQMIPDRIHEPLPNAILNELLTIKEFRQAYDIGGLKPEEFISFGATRRTLAQFSREGWEKLSLLKEKG